MRSIMKRLYILLFAILFATTALGQLADKNISPVTGTNIIQAELKGADDLSRKMSPLLSIFFNRYNKARNLSEDIEAELSPWKEVLSFSMYGRNELTIPVFIKCVSVAAVTAFIENNGGKVFTAAGDIITAEVPGSLLAETALSPDIVYIDASAVSKPKIDVSRVETKVNQVHDGTGLTRPYKGNGVVVGVVDSGIDWKHQDFKNSGGNRIRFLWDMSGSGNPPSGYNYGTEYTKAQLDANQCNEKDLDDGGGHGTHVAGTAAGSGGANASYLGMAPESDIIFVKGFRSGPGFADVDVLNGCSYIFNKAQQLGKPAVINLSLGGHYGPHDGSSLYEQGLSNLTGNGKIIVAAAGNEGGDYIHSSYVTTGSSFQDASGTFFLPEQGATIIAADMWYNSGNISCGIAAFDGSLQFIGATSGVAPGQKIEDLPFTVGSTTYAWVTVDATGTNNPNNGANEVVLVIDSHNGAVNLGAVYWLFYTYGSGTFDAWTIAGGSFDPFSQTWVKGGDTFKTTGMPGTSQKVLCIGSHVTKDRWIDIDGVTRLQPGNPVIGKISSFSSLGPSRDGRIKPDIVAPGEVIIAALSSDLTQTPRPNILQGGKHQKMQGTSMAAPHVAGAVALMLEKNSSLNYEQVVAHLKNTAKKDGFTGNSANNTYGNGKLDAYAAFNAVSGGGGVQTANLVYDDGTPFGGYYWSGSGQGSASRMTPTLNNATVTKMEIYFTGINSGTASYKPIILGKNGSQPGSDLATLPVKTAGSLPGWDATDLLAHSITVNGDFFIGLKYDGVNQPTFGYDQVDNQRAWDYNGTSWSAWNETFFFRASIQTVTSVTEMSNEIPLNFEVSQNYPNPFNPSSSFSISLPEGRFTKVIVYDIQGRKIAELVNNFLQAGTYNVNWNGKNDEGINVASGTYIYSVQSGDFFRVKKMMLVK
jgi:minor extracellular serine protease Vpr